MSSSLDYLFDDYNACSQKYQSQFDYYHQMLDQILQAWHEHRQGNMSASVALYQFQLLCMPMVTEMNETSIKQEADALNIASVLRQDITTAQNDYNNLLALIQQNRSAASGQIAAKALAQAMDKLSQDLHHTGMTKIMGGASGGGASAIANIQNFINDIRGQFFGSQGNSINQYTWVNGSYIASHYRYSYQIQYNGSVGPYIGHAGSFYGPSPFAKRAMQSAILSAEHQTGASGHFSTIFATLHSLPPLSNQHGFHWSRIQDQHSYPHIYSNLKSIMKISGGSNNTILQSVTSDFTSMNQSVSGISSQIQASMNYLNQSLQQYYSIYKSIFDSFSNYMNYIIQKSGG